MKTLPILTNLLASGRLVSARDATVPACRLRDVKSWAAILLTCTFLIGCRRTKSEILSAPRDEDIKYLVQELRSGDLETVRASARASTRLIRESASDGRSDLRSALSEALQRTQDATLLSEILTLRVSERFGMEQIVSGFVPAGDEQGRDRPVMLW